MKSMRRIAPHVDATSPATTLIDRYTGRTDHAYRLRYPRLHEPALDPIEVELIDTSAREEPLRFASGATMWHVLWVRDESEGSVAVESPVGTECWPIAPGDTVGVPRGATMSPAGGQLALAVRVPEDDIEFAPPTHGTERYVGYNRLTDAFRIGDVRLCRWKLTQPLAIAHHYSSPVFVLALARSIVFLTAGMVDQLEQGEAALIDPADGPIAMPDGLGYLLTIDRQR